MTKNGAGEVPAEIAGGKTFTVRLPRTEHCDDELGEFADGARAVGPETPALLQAGVDRALRLTKRQFGCRDVVRPTRWQRSGQPGGVQGCQVSLHERVSRVLHRAAQI